MTTAITGHCSRCGKIWTLDTERGVCRWCGKLATHHATRTQPRSIKSSSRRRQRQVDGNGNGYDQLDGKWLLYYNVALPFAKSVPAQDSGDVLHTIIANLADAGRNNGHKPDNPSWMYRIASFTKAQYWRDHYRHTNGLDCGHCSKAQKAKCREDDLYSDCPKLIKLESLNKPIIDSEGNLTELGDLIADDKALDIPQWVETNEQLLHAPDRLILIGEKIRDGEALTNAELLYISRWRRQEQKKLF